MTTLVVPFRFGHPARDRAWSYVRSWYREVHAGFRIAVGVLEPDEPWSKGRALHRLIDGNDWDVIVVADADVLVAPDDLREAITAVEDGAAWSMPHGEVFRLSRTTTAAMYGGTIDPLPRQMPMRALERQPHRGPWGGGIVVTTGKAWRTSGGIDPAFIDWGGDDVSWARALDTLVGPCVRYDHPMLHLWHPRMYRRPGNRATMENEAVAARYAEAAGDPEKMRAVIATRCQVV